MRRLSARYVFLTLLAPMLTLAEPPEPASENEFLQELPVVLSASRLPQVLADAPAAVTVIDRETIRLSGARDIVDVFRLVPGMQVTNGWEDAAPEVSYHGSYSYYPSSQMQVLIDGRDAYSPYLIGSVGPGLHTVAIDDIERIEVTRGTNSATYGARALLGVINIVTRHTSETHGLAVHAALGENMIADRGFRYGWGHQSANFRLSVNRVGDNGLDGAYERNHTTNVNLVGDIQISPSDSLKVGIDSADLVSGRGFLPYQGYPRQDQAWRNTGLEVRWTRAASTDEDVSLTYTHAHETFSDHFDIRVPALPGEVRVDWGGAADTDNLLFQRITRLQSEQRLVWGGEWRREVVRSPPVYARTSLANRFLRAFGNLEWRLAPAWLLNAGALIEHNNWDGRYLAPRVALNFQFAPGQTLRMAASRGYRPASLFERAADTRYEWHGILLEETYKATGQVRPERADSWEMSYLGQLGPRLLVDARAYREKLGNIIRPRQYVLPPGTVWLGSPQATDFVNSDSTVLRGIEYQLQFRPWPGGRVLFGQNHIRIDSADSTISAAAPRVTTSGAIFQHLAAGVDLSLTLHRCSSYTWQVNELPQLVQPSRRVDLRIAKAYTTGADRGELALVIQNLGPANQDASPLFLFKRQAFVTWRLEL